MLKLAGRKIIYVVLYNARPLSTGVGFFVFCVAFAWLRESTKLGGMVVVGDIDYGGGCHHLHSCPLLRVGKGIYFYGSRQTHEPIAEVASPIAAIFRSAF